jgi:predicted GH43/DUF377 family glycosyl hydrolase
MRNKILTFPAIFLIVSVAYMPTAAPAGQKASEENWALGPFVKQDGSNPCLLPDSSAGFECPVRKKEGLPIREVKWEEKDVFNPAAVVKDGKVYLLYRAEDKIGKHKGTSRIGIAESTDGLSFERHARPVLYPDNDFMKQYEWEGGCEDPRIVEGEDGRYYMTYSAYDGEKARLCVATSRDLYQWKKQGLAFGKPYDGKYRDTWSKSGSIVCKRKGPRVSAAKINGKYWMYWGDTHIFAAESDDLIHWRPLERDGKLLSVFRPREGNFDNELVEPGPPALLTKKGILLIYNSKHTAKDGELNGAKTLPDGTYAAGQVLLDPNDPTHLLERTEDYFFHPERDYEITGQVNNVCFLQGLVYLKDRWLLYYGTADSKIAVATCKPKTELVELARRQFVPLKDSEKTFFVQVEDGECAAFGNEKQDVLRAECIEWLCTNPEASKCVKHTGVHVKGARIDGKLDLSYAKIPFPLRFEKCAFTDDINVEQTTMPALDLTGTHTRSIQGKGLKTDGDVRLRDDFKAKGQVCLKGATISGYLDCSGGKFINREYSNVKRIVEVKDESDRENVALEATGVSVGGNVNFGKGFEAVGVVSLYGAKIGRELDCKGGTFNNPGWVAFNGDQMDVQGCVFQSRKEYSGDPKDPNERFTAHGQVRLIGASIGGDLDCTKGEFTTSAKTADDVNELDEFRWVALKANRARVKGDVLLRDGFKAVGMVELKGATIDGYFDCSGGRFVNREYNNGDGIAKMKESDRKNVALEATGVSVGGNINFGKKFEAVGVVSLYGATIGRELDCKGGTFINPGWVALNGDQMDVQGCVFQSRKEHSGNSSGHFTARGQVRLIGASIGGDLDCKGGKLTHPDPTEPCLSAERVKVGGDVLLSKKFHATGKVSLAGAAIDGCLRWENVHAPTDVNELDLRFANIGTMHIDPCDANWPQKVILYGLEYGEINEKLAKSRDLLIGWLKLQDPDGGSKSTTDKGTRELHSPQPYEQLAAVLSKGGDVDMARKILVEMNDDRRKYETHLPFFKKMLWYESFGRLIG